ATVQDVMLGAIEKRFGDKVPEEPIQWLTDNGSYIRFRHERDVVFLHRFHEPFIRQAWCTVTLF
uniref:hypothetical protein n=1 Tax=Escherichia coli TaxID=562 RepID=UPI0030F49F64